MIPVATETADTLVNMVSQLYKARKDGQYADSLPKFIAKTNILSTAYISNAIYDEAVTFDLLNVMQQMYAGYVLAALGLDDMVSGTRVRERLGRISTEGYVSCEDLAGAKLCGTHNSMHLSLEATPFIDYSKSDSAAPVGKTVEVEFNVGNNTTVKAYVNVAIFPTRVAADTAGDFITLNFSEPMSRRMKQVRAGEISFFKDFLFAVDQTEKIKEALRRDSSGALAGMLFKQKTSIGKAVLSMLGAKPNFNTASTILIIDEPTFTRTCNEIGMDFSNHRTRQKFFGRSMQLFVAVVDTQYASVDLYINGVQPTGTYPFNTLKKASKSDIDVKDVITMLASNSLPKF